MHRVLEDLMLNLDQTLLSRVCSASHTLHEKGAKSVSLVGKGKRKQIAGTFTVNYNVRSFLPMHRRPRDAFNKESRFRITLS